MGRLLRLLFGAPLPADDHTGAMLRWLVRLLLLIPAAFGVKALLWRCRQRPSPRPHRPKSRADCQPVPSTKYRRPDPLIYSQTFLMSQGLPVTWDNPDITIQRNGVPVDPHALEPDTEYDIVARVWNGSQHAPAVGMPVHFGYLDFGIGMTPIAIGTAPVTVGVKGSAHCPAFVIHPWRTPAAAGHYCLQVTLEWADDVNPANNLGQTNTDVQALNSPRARFLVPVRNPTRRGQVVRLDADGYTLPTLVPCDEPNAEVTAMPREERDRRVRTAVANHSMRRTVPDSWQVELEPQQVELAPGETVEVVVEVEAPDGFRGRQAFNVNALAGAELLGGVTLYAEGEADAPEAQEAEP